MSIVVIIAIRLKLLIEETKGALPGVGPFGEAAPNDLHS